MKLYIVFLCFGILISSCFMVKITKNFSRADMVHEDLVFKFKTVNSQWGNLIDTSYKIDPFTGSEVVQHENEMTKKPIPASSKSLKSANQNNKSNYKSGSNFSKNGGKKNGEPEYGPLENPGKAGVIYDYNFANDDKNNWNGHFSQNIDNSVSSKASASQSSTQSASFNSNMAAMSQSSEIHSEEANTEESHSNLNQQASFFGSQASSSQASKSSSTKKQMSMQNVIKNSGINGKSNLSISAAGNTDPIDEEGNVIKVEKDSLSGMNSSRSQSQSSYASQSNSNSHLAAQSSSYSGSAGNTGSYSEEQNSNGVESRNEGSSEESETMSETSSESEASMSSVSMGSTTSMSQKSSEFTEKTSSTGYYAKKFKCSKEQIIKAIDSRYQILKLVDQKVGEDNSARFFCLDKTNNKTVSLKLFFKGMPHNCEFFNLAEDKVSTEASRDCKNINIINNRLYNLPPDFEPNKTGYEKYKGKEMFKDIQFPVCKGTNSNSGGVSNFYQIYDLPEGENLKQKCILERNNTNEKSCIPILRTVAQGVLHGIQILNFGNKFFLHGNIEPNSLYIKLWSGENKIFLDNIKFETNNYNDKQNKPSSIDMDMLGDTLLKLLLGTDNLKSFKFPIKSSFDLYVKTKEYFKTQGLLINIKNQALNVPADIDSGTPKIVNLAENLDKLSKSIFDFIYKLKNTNVQPNNQFLEAAQALKHPFIESGIPKNNFGVSLGSCPSDLS